MRTLSVLLLAGCGAADNACETYIETALACASSAGADTTRYDVDIVCGEWTDGAEDRYGPWYECRTRAWEEADCSSPEGAAVAEEADAACTP